MQVGYMRISKADGSQVLDLQHDALLAAGVEADHIYQDKASGSKDDRRGLTACLKALRKGDALVIWKLDRLGRNLKRNRRRSQQTRRWLQSHSRRADRHHDLARQTHVHDVPGSCRVRARRHPRAHPRWACLCKSPWPRWRTQDRLHSLEASPGSGGHGKPRHATSWTSARSSISAGPRSTTTSHRTASLQQGAKRCCIAEGMQAKTGIEVLRWTLSRYGPFTPAIEGEAA
jgi:hypothetical protein